MTYIMNYTRDDIQTYLEEIGETVLLADGFEHAFLGTTQRMNEPLLAVYSYPLMIETLMLRDGMTYTEASEYIDFNVAGAWVGEQTPVIVHPMNL
ncbi:hypothetical protein UFOVP1217_19 [uncultured Caudovirales phage]|uniref:Uncharacterized protein n=1 Tax=uncultured Caudovirales phage TaxID=2100421 RepID=A0A6J5SSN8_9CAUD|nr:hypothetical protein UFOVP465_97 [uncultured Caudovirales phage]CAB4156756.1 hypothetical protein UFOVP666_143 [uncultured Caudovirales phage]CAB4160023.1 hypothetical protein UFOVP727_32 [uncultured Caudovirales phage]CAB4164902.1 hypothetical protein UFOVP819_171 [uncultured Caudovirales phage]CAB4172260.1 hypothetical protein UFOVP926_103 [uncultured Caudovirales phage]